MRLKILAPNHTVLGIPSYIEGGLVWFHPTVQALARKRKRKKERHTHTNTHT